MLVKDILARKGSAVASIDPAADAAQVVSLLAEHDVGALVVTADGHGIDGIVTERDVARHLHRHGAAVLGLPVRDLMTSPVRTCRPDEQIRDVAKTMTDGRFRHLPVVVDERLAGIVSIGDIVKGRIDELEAEASQLADYVLTGQ